MSNRELIERDLDEFVEGDAWPEAQENGESAPVTDTTTATRILRRMKRLSKEIADIEEAAANDLRRIELWRDDRVAVIKRQIEWAASSLEPFARETIPKLPEKTLRLPDGELSLRDPGVGRIVVEDEGAFIDWANERGMVGDENDPNVVLAVRKVSKTQIPKHLAQDTEPMAIELDDMGTEFKVYGFRTRDGAVVPGVTRVVAAHDKFDLKIGEA